MGFATDAKERGEKRAEEVVELERDQQKEEQLRVETETVTSKKIFRGYVQAFSTFTQELRAAGYTVGNYMTNTAQPTVGVRSEYFNDLGLEPNTQTHGYITFKPYTIVIVPRKDGGAKIWVEQRSGNETDIVLDAELVNDSSEIASLLPLIEARLAPRIEKEAEEERKKSLKQWPQD